MTDKEIPTLHQTSNDMELKNEFKCVVEVNAQPIELSFRQVLVPRGGKYFIVASTLKGITSSFEIIADSDQKWQIAPPVPKWLHALEDRLSAIMIERSGCEQNGAKI